jgi:hypothetical protein
VGCRFLSCHTAGHRHQADRTDACDHVSIENIIAAAIDFQFG